VKEKESILSKGEIVNALVEEGFDEDEASRVYELIMDELERALRGGRSLYFRRLFKVWPARMPPRRYWDNWNKRYIYFGERIMLKVKPFFLKDRNMPANRKIRAGRRSPEEGRNGQEVSTKEIPRKEMITKGQLGKANRTLKKLGITFPSLEQKEELVRAFFSLGINPTLKTSSFLANHIRSEPSFSGSKLENVKPMDKDGAGTPKRA
jgi:hypothetical protein